MASLVNDETIGRLFLRRWQSAAGQTGIQAGVAKSRKRKDVRDRYRKANGSSPSLCGSRKTHCLRGIHEESRLIWRRETGGFQQQVLSEVEGSHERRPVYDLCVVELSAILPQERANLGCGHPRHNLLLARSVENGNFQRPGQLIQGPFAMGRRPDQRRQRVGVGDEQDKHPPFVAEPGIGGGSSDGDRDECPSDRAIIGSDSRVRHAPLRHPAEAAVPVQKIVAPRRRSPVAGRGSSPGEEIAQDDPRSTRRSWALHCLAHTESVAGRSPFS